jgi:hypoxanthine-DNA glycosylase
MKRKIIETFCQSFDPFINKKSRVLILGSMPGPMALRKQEYYGFTGNHFWKIIPNILKAPPPQTYKEKLTLIKKNNIALWDVFESCVRPGALDSDIKNEIPNNIPRLLKKYPNVKAVFINGRFAHNSFKKIFEGKVNRPYFYLPSTSPANAVISIKKKENKWKVILDYLTSSSFHR